MRLQDRATAFINPLCSLVKGVSEEGIKNPKWWINYCNFILIYRSLLLRRHQRMIWIQILHAIRKQYVCSHCIFLTNSADNNSKCAIQGQWFVFATIEANLADGSASDCLAKNSYKEERCRSHVDALYDCCQAFYSKYGDDAKSVSCPKASLLKLKLRQRAESTKWAITLLRDNIPCVYSFQKGESLR